MDENVTSGESKATIDESLADGEVHRVLSKASQPSARLQTTSPYSPHAGVPGSPSISEGTPCSSRSSPTSPLRDDVALMMSCRAKVTPSPKHLELDDLDTAPLIHSSQSPVGSPSRRKNATLPTSPSRDDVALMMLGHARVTPIRHRRKSAAGSPQKQRELEIHQPVQLSDVHRELLDKEEQLRLAEAIVPELHLRLEWAEATCERQQADLDAKERLIEELQQQQVCGLCGNRCRRVCRRPTAITNLLPQLYRP